MAAKCSRVLPVYSPSSFVCASVRVRVLTQFPGRFDVNVVVAAADADDDTQRFELLQVFSHQSDGVVHQSSYGFVQHLDTHTTHRVSEMIEG